MVSYSSGGYVVFAQVLRHVRTSRLPCHTSAFIRYASHSYVPREKYAGKRSAANKSWRLKPDT
jgi:hypothetical protein